MRGNRKQDARLAQQLVPQPVVAHCADLQRDESVVLAVEGLDDAALAARAERLDHVIAVLDEASRRCREVSARMGHGAIICRGAGPRNRPRGQVCLTPGQLIGPPCAHGARGRPGGCSGHERSTEGLRNATRSRRRSWRGGAGHARDRHRGLRQRRRRSAHGAGSRERDPAGGCARPRPLPHAQGRGARVPARGGSRSDAPRTREPSRASRRS